MTYTGLSTFMSKPAPITKKKARHSTLRIYLILKCLSCLISCHWGKLKNRRDFRFPLRSRRELRFSGLLSSE